MTFFTTTFTFALFALSAVNAQVEPRCYQVGQTVHAMDLDAICAHSTHNYDVAFDIEDGCLKFLVEPGQVVTELELYSGQRMTTQWEDCCPPETWTHNMNCEHVPVEGECCYSDDAVHVTGLTEDLVQCVHDVVDYTSYVPENGTVWWASDDGENNTHVELYGSIHSNGCCEKFLYAIECSPCA